MAQQDAPRLLARGRLSRRQMSDGAVAGTVVGVVVGVFLLALCLYPVIICQIKRRRRPKSQPLDGEVGPPQRPDGPDAAAGLDNRRRLSSSDSFKRNGELPRGAVSDARGNKEWGLPSQNQIMVPIAASYAPRWQDWPAGTNATAADSSRAVADPTLGEPGLESSPAPQPFYLGEYMPVSEVRDDHPGVLRGTSADYYSTSIPSEAFGMSPAPADAPDAIPRSSRRASFRFNVRHMFRRPSDRDRAADFSTPTASAQGSVPASYDASARQQMTTHQELTESPTALSPSNIAPATSDSAAPAEAPPASAPLASVQVFPPPPSHPAPGTVNPMDVMPASTESELWHRTEHELSGSFHRWSATASPPHGYQHSANSDNRADTAVSPAPQTPSTVLSPQTGVDAGGSTPAIALAQSVEIEPQDDATGTGAPQPQDPASPPALSQPRRHQRYLSDQSNSLQRPGSTDLSSHNTPSTPLDTPSPESLTSSDFRHSVSPPSAASATKTVAFRCDEPGCHSTFDQPHKLKHHQRYHKKKHKCPYASCDKGFGTKTHLQRHINDRHEKRKKFHCSVQGCEYSRAGGKGFPRKDNWRRHMVKFHNLDQANLPEPIEMDQEMSGVEE